MLYFIQRNACPLFLLPVLPWSISGLCLELGTEVGGTGIVQPVGYFVEGQFTVIQQFLGAFDFLGDKAYRNRGGTPWRGIATDLSAGGCPDGVRVR